MDADGNDGSNVSMFTIDTEEEDDPCVGSGEEFRLGADEEEEYEDP